MESDFKDLNDVLSDMLDTLPRLSPVWHDVTYQDFIRQKHNYRFMKDILPDFGGAGVDIRLLEDEFNCIETKCVADHSNYVATACSLPFFPANKVSDQSDTCLAPLRKANTEFKLFCKGLEWARRNFNSKNRKPYKREILSTYKAMNKMSQSNKLKKVLLPDSVLRLAMIFPEKTIIPPINFSYIGGCLATSHIEDGSCILLHPTGEKLNQLGIAILEETIQEDKHFNLTTTNKNLVRLKGGSIKQITSAVDGYCYVRKEKSCHFVDFSNPSSISQSKLIKHKNVINISSSPYDPQDYIVIYNNENLELKNLGKSEPIWILDQDTYSVPCAEIGSLECSFGSHPRSILCLNEKSLYAFDIRLKSKIQSTIFSADYPSCFTEEKLLCFKNSAVSSFQHAIATNYHLLLCDERYPKRPVLIYNHMLSGYPLYCDVATLNASKNSSDVMIVLGTQDSNELSTFAIRSQHPLVQPMSLRPPMLLSSPTDCADSLKLHCIYVDESLVQRLSYPLVGVSILLHKQDSGFTAFQLNSLGDLFFQDFAKNTLKDVEKTRRVDLGCVLTPPSRIQPHLSQFRTGIKEMEKESINSVELSSSCLVELQVDLTEYFDSMKNIPPNCGVCNPSKDTINVNVEENDSNACPSCGLNSIQRRDFNVAFNNEGLLLRVGSQPLTLEDFDVSPFYDYNDTISKKLLSVWDFQDSISKSESPTYHCDSDWSYATTPTYKWDSDSSLDLSISTSPCPSESSLPSLSVGIPVSGPESKDDVMRQLFQDSTHYAQNTFTHNSQEFLEDFVPPSQEVRPLIGETLRLIKRPRTSVKSEASAGF